jgi:lysine decarboxylase
VFSALDDHTELHLTILEGVKRRSDTPFFNALIAYSRR